MISIECVGGKLDGEKVPVESIENAPSVVFTVERIKCQCGRGCVVFRPVVYRLGVPKDKTFSYILVQH